MTKFEELIKDKEFIDQFILVTNEIYKYTGDYKGVFEYYENEFIEDEIEELLVYCEKYDLLEDQDYKTRNNIFSINKKNKLCTDSTVITTQNNLTHWMN